MVICILIVALSGCGKEEPKVYRVGIVYTIDPLVSIADSFKAKMAELGYIEGENIAYDVQKTSFEPNEIQQVLKGFVEDKVDLIFAFPTELALAAKAATEATNIPVVFAYSTTEGNNLVESVRQPGGNITGVREIGSDIEAKRLEILHELAPQAKLVYITYKVDAPPAAATVEALQKASSLMNITLVKAPVTTIEEMKARLQEQAALDDLGMDAILLLSEPICASPAGTEAISRFAAKHKVPMGGIGKYSVHEEWGAKAIIFSYEVYLDDIGKLAATLADKILKGTPAGTIPVVTPEAKLLINYKVAQELGLTVPEGLLARADEIIR